MKKQPVTKNVRKLVNMGAVFSEYCLNFKLLFKIRLGTFIETIKCAPDPCQCFIFFIYPLFCMRENIIFNYNTIFGRITLFPSVLFMNF